MALPAITVVKVGGKVIDNPHQSRQFLARFARLSGPKILVHGGGILANQLAEKLGLPITFHDGRRITDLAMIKVVRMVYSGVNKELTAILTSLGERAIGLSGGDDFLIKAYRRPPTPIDYGYVGDIESINSDLLISLLDKGLVPVIAPLSCDKNGDLLNTNADTIASSLTRKLAENGYQTSLFYTMDLPGVLKDKDQPSSLLKTLTESEALRLKKQGIISQGMIPKIDNCFAAKKAGAKLVVICSPEAVGDESESGYSQGTQLI